MRDNRAFFNGLTQGLSLQHFRDAFFESQPALFKLTDIPVVDTDLFREMAEKAAATGSLRVLDGAYREDVRLQNHMQNRCDLKQELQCFDRFLTAGGDSLLIEYYEQYDERIAALCDALTLCLNTYVHASVFLSPPSSQATDIHWDQMDVFAAQILGSKQWEVFLPQQHLPNRRIPTPRGAIRKSSLKEHSIYTLCPGDVLYLPRGWIHEVKALPGSASIHVSLVAFMNSPITILANAVDCAFTSMRASEEWRWALTRESLNNGRDDLRLARMRDAFTRLLDDQLTGDLSRHLDHIPFGTAERRVQAEAKASVANLLTDHKSAMLVRTTLQPIWREYAQLNEVKFSVDGRCFFTLPLTVWKLVMGCKDLSLNSLETLTGLDQDTLLSCLDILIQKTGMFRLAYSFDPAEFSDI